MSNDPEQYATRWKEAAHAPTGLAGRARSWLRGSALSALSLANQRLENSFLRCLYCHYVFDDQREAFDRILGELKAVGTFVNTDDCASMLRGEKAIVGRNFHLSFDDGFMNNYTNAFPILKRQKIPAIFFVPTGMLAADWETTRRYCLETTGYAGAIQLMSWENAAEMAGAGYEIGSHTRTHARFAKISGDDSAMECEISGSKHDIESRLGIACKYISWPFGRIEDADSRSLEMTKSAGYEACFGAFRGTINPGTTDPFRIPRHHFEAQWPVSHIKYFARGNMEAS